MSLEGLINLRGCRMALVRPNCRESTYSPYATDTDRYHTNKKVLSKLLNSYNNTKILSLFPPLLVKFLLQKNRLCEVETTIIICGDSSGDLEMINDAILHTDEKNPENLNQHH